MSFVLQGPWQWQSGGPLISCQAQHATSFAVSAAAFILAPGALLAATVQYLFPDAAQGAATGLVGTAADAVNGPAKLAILLPHLYHS